MHIRGGKSDIFGSECCQKWYFWVQRKLKLCWWYFLIPNIVILIFLGSMEAILTSICIVWGYFMFMYKVYRYKMSWYFMVALKLKWYFWVAWKFLGLTPRMRMCWVPPWGAVSSCLFAHNKERAQSLMVSRGSLTAFSKVQSQMVLMDQVPIYTPGWSEAQPVLSKDAFLKCRQFCFRTRNSWIVSPTPYHYTTKTTISVWKATTSWTTLH